jgi:hypothetical protein
MIVAKKKMLNDEYAPKVKPKIFFCFKDNKIITLYMTKGNVEKTFRTKLIFFCF